MNNDRLAAVILTYNEEANLPDCLRTLQPLGCPVFVIDSGSTDRTLEIARLFGAHLLSHPFQNHTTQWQWALENLPCRPEWVLALDADQRLTPDAAQEIGSAVEAGGTADREQIEAYYINRRQIFRGKWIRHGGYYPKYLLKLFRKDRVRFDPRDLVDHHFYVPGRTAKLRHDLLEVNVKEDQISFWLEKHVRYARLLAQEELLRREKADAPLEAKALGSPDHRALWRKGLWYRLPLYWRPFLFFIYRYFFQAGILDGKVGFIFHFLQAFWFRLVIDIQVEELLATGKKSYTPELHASTTYDS